MNKFFFRGNLVKVRATFTVSQGPYKRFQELVSNMSAEVDGFIRQRVSELAGQAAAEDGYDYEDLKTNYTRLSDELAKKLDKMRARPEYKPANELILKLGIREDFSNADELIPKLSEDWKGTPWFLQEFITLVELARDTKRAKKLLVEARARIYKSSASTEKSGEQP